MIDIINMANIIKDNGGELYLVGGAVRDKYLGVDSTDLDYCVVGIDESEFIKLFPYAFKRGNSFPVFDIDGVEFALARREIKVSSGHNGFDIISNKNITILEDLERRDITINSMAINVLTDELIDPFNGLRDLRNKVIKATSDKFIEDPLRVYRVARLACKYRFSVDNDTVSLMNKLKSELSTLSSERVFNEFRLALSYDKPSIFFNILRQANVLDVHFKEIYNLIGSLQPIKYHPEGDSYNHTMEVVDRACTYTNNIEIRFAALVHDLGKGVTPKNEYPHHYNHDINGINLVKALGKRIKLPTRYIKCGITACSEHMNGGIFYQMKPSKQVHFIERVSSTILGLEGLKVVVLSDKGNRSNKELLFKIDFLKIGNIILDTIDGEYIKNKYNITPSIEFKQILTKERIKWLSNYLKNNK